MSDALSLFEKLGELSDIGAVGTDGKWRQALSRFAGNREIRKARELGSEAIREIQYARYRTLRRSDERDAPECVALLWDAVRLTARLESSAHFAQQFHRVQGALGSFFVLEIRKHIVPAGHVLTDAIDH